MQNSAASPSKHSLSIPTSRQVSDALALFAAASIIVFLSIAFSREVGRVAAIWPLNAFVLAFLVWRPRNTWPVLLAIVWSANAIVNAAMGDSWLRAIVLSLANSAEIAVCAWLLFRPGAQFDISRFGSLVRFIVVAGVLGPLVSAMIAAITLSPDAPLLLTVEQWMLADGLGMLVFAPALFILGDRARESAEALRLRDLTLGPVVLLGALVVVFGQTSFPLLFCVPPALMLLTFRLGVKGAAGGILATAFVAIAFTLAGNGPIQLVRGDAFAKLHTLQAFLALISVTTLPLAAALAEGRRALAARDAINAQLTAAREEAERATALAEINARRYKELTDYSTDILVRFGPGGIISHATPAIRMLGMKPEEVVGMSTVDFAAPEDRAFAQAVTDGLFSGDELDEAIRREFRIRRPDGSILWLEGSPTIIRDEHGKPTEVVSIYRDITKRRELEDNLSEARKKAEAATEVKAAFLAQMSHEIRTPLNSIVGFSRLLAGAGGLTPNAKRYADIVASCGDSLLALINDVLDLSKWEAGPPALERLPFSLGGLVTKVCDEVRVLADAKGLALSVSIDGALADAHLGDQVRLRQVLLNLLNNAIKFTEIGGVELHVTAASIAGGPQSLLFEVRDTGIGIAEAHLPALFSPFVQGDNSIARRYGGTGLGLSIVREIVTAMGGECGARSELGRGSVFWVEIHIDVADAAAGPDTIHEAHAQAAPQRILVVDDVDLNRELAGILLQQAGHEVDFASNGAEALRLAQAWPYDLIFMDVQMPGMDGLSATRAIRDVAGLEHMPIIAMTAQALPDQVTACLASGMNDYIAKPLEPSVLYAMIAKWRPANADLLEAPATGDDAMADLRRRFIERSEGDLRYIAALLNDGREVDDDARTRIHRLAGSASAFGFAKAGAAARVLDEKLSQGMPCLEYDFAPLIKELESVQAA